MTRPDQSPQRPARRSFLRRLASDTRGNTLALVGAALVPLTGMIGSGVDISRAYMAKTRLQTACDAATLAGRRVMTNDEVGQVVRDEAGRFFAFNFPTGVYGSDPIALSTGNPPPDGTAAHNTLYIWRADVGTVAGRANTALPTGVMHLFGFDTMDIEVECEASQNFINTDIMFVLDTTGSMLCTPEEPGTCGRTNEIPTSRIVALRDAIEALDAELQPVRTQLEAAGMRLRYGFVPYSSAVNAGGILDDAHVANSALYQTRSPIYRTTQTDTFNNQNATSCGNRGQARSPAFPNYPSVDKVATLNGTTCTVRTNTYSRTVTPTFDHWIYEQATHDTSQFKLGSASNPTRTVGTSETNTWNGCIEERETDSSIDGGNSYTIPSGATDLDIDLVPTDDATRWKPHWREVLFRRTADGPSLYHNGIRKFMGSTAGVSTFTSAPANWACPSPAARLRPWTSTQLTTYLDGLVAVGGTYHDTGMIWGTRLLSRDGIFAADNPVTWQNMQVSRHLIFMTDGDLQPNTSTYTAYAMEDKDRRIIGSQSISTQTARHRQRFRMMCNAARGREVTVWVVSFATTPSANSLADMRACSGEVEERFIISRSAADLVQRFEDIAKNIGSLRLTQ